MIEVTVEIKGLAELDAAIRALPDAMQDKVVRAGLTAAGKVFVDGMERRAPKDPHHRVLRKGQAYALPLSQSIVTRVSLAKDQATVKVGPSKQAFWGRFQELGTKYQTPQPFMTPTLQADGQIAVAAFATIARDKLEDVAAAVRSA
jgi:HK97 gp10 family phage protein